MTWGQQRQTYILTGLALIVLVPTIIYLALSLYEKPTCFDGKQNAAEEGIDCGGSCQLVCREATTSINTIWSRVFEEGATVTGSALLENVNTRAIAVDVPYKFTIFRGDLELDTAEGVVTVPPKQRIPIIAEGMTRGVQNVDYHRFEVGEPREWIYEQGETSPFLISNQVMDAEGSNPRVSARVKNIEFDKVIKDSYFVTFIYDEFDSVITQSTTYVKNIKPQEIVDIFFTWNVPFEREAVRFDVLELKR